MPVEVRAKVGEAGNGAVHAATRAGFVLLNAPAGAQVAEHVATLARAPPDPHEQA
ncbi:hypothetical protein [Kitasatospora cheerisanensis]|uniref:Uncharacterized protein n=1 Tax=Kitasatospora cheerisanensis KCTC 2395 TaxID=1348663 RepID=A0A066YQF0_9ACTN|nr:hypothetical protein [Kitasatospora cheerisanensis]KDN82179.1 hypothetical protein KCH_60130 [Kitasatospora cheerisanensis KCTC 2395]